MLLLRYIANSTQAGTGGEARTPRERKLETQRINQPKEFEMAKSAATHPIVQPVLRFHQKDQDVFLGVIPSSLLNQWTKVWDISTEPKEGYQRPPIEARFREFAKYLTTPEGYMTPIIINCRGHWRFLPDGSGSVVGQLQIEGPGSILDGQHRRGGLILALEQGQAEPVPFLAYNDLHHRVEVDLFDTINSKARPLSKSLLDFNQRDKDLDVQVALLLDTEPDSPLYQQLSYSGSRDGTRRITLEGMRRAMAPIFRSGKLSALVKEDRAQAMKAFFKAVADTWATEWSDSKNYKLRELTGMAAVCMVAGDVLSESYDAKTRRVDEKKIGDLLQKAAGHGIDWTKKGEYSGQSGFGGALVIGKDLAQAIWSK